jgi:hypothetical protein
MGENGISLKTIQTKLILAINSDFSTEDFVSIDFRTFKGCLSGCAKFKRALIC